ncbi:MAG: c-type cytochrome biogenesis protein CcmI [Pseudomonadota bacterium]
MIWIVLTAMLGLAAFFAAAPFLATAKSKTGDEARAALYENQIAEINRDAAAGVLSEPEANALRVEAQRRLLAASDADNLMEPKMSSPRLVASIAIAGIVAITGAALYAVKGNPTAPSVSHPEIASAPENATAPASAIGSVDGMIEGLKSRLEKEPGNADGWRMLGWSYFNLGRHREAADAYARAAALAPEIAAYQSSYGEALVMTAGGFVTPDAIKAFDLALKSDPSDPRARFFKALAIDQAGDPAGAIAQWIEIVNAAPDDAEWAGDLRRRIETRAKEASVDIKGKLKSPATAPILAAAPAPTAEQVRAAMELPADDRQAMIEGMVARLAGRLKEDPKDADGWIRLMRSHMALGRENEARGDLATALAAFADDPQTHARIASEAAALGVNAQ